MHFKSFGITGSTTRVALNRQVCLPLQVCAISTVRAGKGGGLTGMCVDVLGVEETCVLQDEGLILILRLETRGVNHVHDYIVDGYLG